MTAEECGDLRVYRGPNANGELTNISCFELSDDEIRELVETRRVWLHAFGEYQQPIALSVEDPWRPE
jgi:hypothetical protein